MPSTTGMKGGGYYDRHSGAQLSAIRALQGWVDESVAGLPLPAGTVTILDLGSSEGRNAIHVMASIAAGLRRRTDLPLQAIYSDLASNNFNQLFANLEQARSDGVLGEGIYPGAVGGSFYGPLLPPGTVHLATCFNAVHWLDRPSAVNLTEFVAYRRPIPSHSGPPPSPSEAAASFTRQAEQDLVRFLECRARELVPGATLLVASPGDTDEFRLGDDLYDVLNDACLDVAVHRCSSPAAGCV
jgi:gibberellin A4 carboxyl methyltransferase